MLMDSYTLKLDGTSTLIWTKSDPIQQQKIQKNSRKILWKRYKMYMIIMKAYMKGFNIIYVL